jgi:glutaminyl-tRNA synthetase
VPFCRDLLVEEDDFREVAPKGWFRLAPGAEVRLRSACLVRCREAIKDADGRVVELRCTWDPDSQGGMPKDGRKVKGTLHWVSAPHAVEAEVRLYDRLCRVPKPEEGGADFLAALNPASLEIVRGARLEASLASAEVGSRWQLERVGYFVVDGDARPGAPVLNRIVTLRDSYAEKPAEKPEEAAAPADPGRGERERNRKAQTRPKSRSPQEYRAEARARDPELAAAHERIGALVGAEAADLLAGDRATASLFLGTVELAAGHAELVAKWMINELPRALAGKELAASGLDAARLAELIRAVGGGALATPAAKGALAEMIATGKPLAEVAVARGGAGVTRDDLAARAKELLAAHADKLAQYRAGKTGLRGFFVGQLLKAAPGADPKDIQDVLGAELGD